MARARHELTKNDKLQKAKDTPVGGLFESAEWDQMRETGFSAIFGIAPTTPVVELVGTSTKTPAGGLLGVSPATLVGSEAPSGSSHEEMQSEPEGAMHIRIMITTTLAKKISFEDDYSKLNVLSKKIGRPCEGYAPRSINLTQGSEKNS